MTLMGTLFIALINSASPLVGQDWAKKMFSELSHDFGTVTKEERPVHKFKITNPYNEEIRIREIRSSCGCTTVSIDKRSLKTRETAELTARYNSHLFDGFRQATITVRFDAPFYGEVQLLVKGNIIRGVGINPRAIEFGEVIAGSTDSPARTVQVSRSGDFNFKVVDVQSTFPHIAVQFGQTSRNRNSVNYQMIARLKTETIPVGFTGGELIIVTRDSTGVQRKWPVKFNARVVAPLQISPQVLTMGKVKPGEEVTKKVIIKADQPFRITDVTCVNTQYRVRAKASANKVHIVEVSYTGGDGNGKQENELNFITDLGGGTKSKVKAIVEQITEVADADSSVEIDESGN